MDKLRFEIPKRRAETPALAVMVIASLFGWGAHNHLFGYSGGFVWLAVIIPVIIWVYKKRAGEYFVEVDETGIGWRQHFFSRYNYIPWSYLQRIDYLEFEINFMLKETAQVVSFQLSGLDEEQADELKEKISSVIGNREKEQ
jgi:membrane protein YdbS with pleckstrin-like domain